MSLVLDATEEDLKVFLEEADELLQLLDEDLVRLENEPENVGLLQEIFRAAHTLKGSSATIGHQKMATLTHAMESLLDKLRKGEISINADIVSALLEALDALRVLEREIATLEESGIQLEAILRQLSQVTETANQPGDEIQRNEISAPLLARGSGEPSFSADGTTFDIRVHLNPESSLPAARALQVILALSEPCEVCWTEPSLDDISAEKVGSELRLAISTPWHAEKIRETIMAVEDVVAAEVSLPEQRPEGHSGNDGASTASSGASTSPSGDGAKPQGEIAKKATQGLTRMASTVRIEVERLDTLLNLVGELVIERTRLAQLGSALEYRYAEEPLVGHLNEASERVARITDQLQEQVMQSRMLPIENVFSRLPRAVRDLAVKIGKKVNLVIEGQDTELDRSVIEELSDPLLHLLRNAVDHGLEPPEDRMGLGKPEIGTIKLTAAHADNQVIITVEDDGRGIDAAKVRRAAVEKKLITQEAAEKLSDRDAVHLIFAAGLSTAKQVSDVSGRGVGMDVVRTNIEKLNGSVDVETELGVGTKFTVRLPLTLAIIQALFVVISDAPYAIPMVSVTETLRVAPSDIHTIRGKEAIIYRGMVLPIIRVSEVFGEDLSQGDPRSHLFVVAVRAGNKQVGLMVDSLLGQQDIVIKPLGTFLGDIRGVSGATIMGDGRVALIIDVLGLVKNVAEV